ncbi:hypothetical protein BDZ89DRAFT_1111712 [Hymenopellis radicata]|nr:hypothetical protein BDZ89DRAFT_1111712 [Hymenopellis radicata]
MRSDTFDKFERSGNYRNQESGCRAAHVIHKPLGKSLQVEGALPLTLQLAVFFTTTKDLATPFLDVFTIPPCRISRIYVPFRLPMPPKPRGGAPDHPVRPSTKPLEPSVSLIDLDDDDDATLHIIDAMWIDRTYPRIRAVTLSELSWPSDNEKLSLADSNFTRWSETLRAVLTLSHPLIYHIEPSDKNDFYAKPNPDEEPFAYTNWIANDATVVAFAKQQMMPEEKAVYKAHTTAAALWTAITTRHLKRRVVAQVTFILKLLSLTLVPGDDHAQKIHEMVMLNKRLWEMGTPTEDVFLCAALIRAMGTHYRDYRSLVMENLSRSTKANPYTSEDIRKLFELVAAIEKDDAL